MEFRLMVNGQPVTEWEAIRARDVSLWKQATRSTLQLGDRDVIEAQSRKPGTPVTANPSKAALVAQAEMFGIDVPKSETKAQVQELTDSA